MIKILSLKQDIPAHVGEAVKLALDAAGATPCIVIVGDAPDVPSYPEALSRLAGKMESTKDVIQPGTVVLRLDSYRGNWPIPLQGKSGKIYAKAQPVVRNSRKCYEARIPLEVYHAGSRDINATASRWIVIDIVRGEETPDTSGVVEKAELRERIAALQGELDALRKDRDSLTDMLHGKATGTETPVEEHEQPRPNKPKSYQGIHYRTLRKDAINRGIPTADIEAASTTEKMIELLESHDSSTGSPSSPETDRG